jgi:hypothetical protein
MGVTPYITAALGLGMVAIPALAQEFCVRGEGDGPISLGYDVKPSLVAHSDAIMDATRGDLGLDGEADERAFSFRRTIDAILESVPEELRGPIDDDMRRGFVQTMIDSFQPPGGKALNAEAGVLMPLQSRSEATELTAEAMLDDASPNAMKPLALFNRLDLADEAWTHCGEHRIVYGRQPADPSDRFTLIFEAMVPNPDPASGAEGCRRVAEFWAGLTGQDELEQTRRLSEFYYEGGTGHADGDLEGPVVSFRNYGGDGHRGQVRANAFMQPPWQLREWLTQLSFSTEATPVVFVPVTVKDNPLAQLYRDDIMVDPELVAGNIPAVLTSLHGQFIQALTSSISQQLLSEGTAKHQDFVANLSRYDLGAAPVDADDVLLNTIALGNDDRFNEHQSVSQGGEDVPGAVDSITVTALLDQVGATPSPHLNQQSGQTILNRARAGSCGGCHMTASRSAGGFFQGPGAIVLEKEDGSVVRWPDIHGDLFVHVSEKTRELSPALEDNFLPVRRYAMGRYLCDELDEEPPTAEPGETPYVARAVALDVPAEDVEQPARFVDRVIASYMQAAGTAAADGAPADPAAAQAQDRAALAGMSPAARNAVRRQIAEVIGAMRDEERAEPGAFYATRRPH